MQKKSYSKQSFGKFRKFRKFSKKGKKPANNIDVSKFVSKAKEQKVEKPYVAKNHFSDFQIDLKLKQNIANAGFTVPMPIQDQSIPQILSGKDLVGIANTGTGKTAAFLIPMINKILSSRSEKVLIMTPTRELALQIQSDLISFSRSLGIWSVACIGGSNIHRQLDQLRKRYDFIIGTPGRIKDLIQRKALNLSMFNNVVLDEVDRMLDIGFKDDIKEILNFVPAKRQSLFFSATLSPEIDELIRTFSKNPVTVSVKSGETSHNVDQDVVRISSESDKIEVLHSLLLKEDFKKVLIFGKTKAGVSQLSYTLYERGFRVASIHGDKTQFKRQRALKQFRENQINILVATDVAARGLDIDGVTHVINFDLPNTYEDYVHRIGRTGRANKKGVALTFVGSEQRQSRKQVQSRRHYRRR